MGLDAHRSASADRCWRLCSGWRLRSRRAWLRGAGGAVGAGLAAERGRGGSALRERPAPLAGVIGALGVAQLSPWSSIGMPAFRRLGIVAAHARRSAGLHGHRHQGARWARRVRPKPSASSWACSGRSGGQRRQRADRLPVPSGAACRSSWRGGSWPRLLGIFVGVPVLLYLRAAAPLRQAAGTAGSDPSARAACR